MTSSGQAWVAGLMPANTPAALKPAGAVTPPSIFWILMSSPVAALDMEGCGAASVSGVTSRSVTIANCSHCRNSAQLRQSAAIFSGSQVCGTIEKPMCAKYAG